MSKKATILHADPGAVRDAIGAIESGVSNLEGLHEVLRDLSEVIGDGTGEAVGYLANRLADHAAAIEEGFKVLFHALHGGQHAEQGDAA